MTEVDIIHQGQYVNTQQIKLAVIQQFFITAIEYGIIPFRHFLISQRK